MRKLSAIIVHCSATKVSQNVTVSDIEKWHIERGFSKIGYHFVIDLEGNIFPGRNIEEIGAHAKGHNSNTIGICYLGGLSEMGISADTRTDAQKVALRKLIAWLVWSFDIPNIFGHNVVANKACPCFDASAEYLSLVNYMLVNSPYYYPHDTEPYTLSAIL